MDQTVLVAALVFLLVVQAGWSIFGVSNGERHRAIRRLSSYTVPTWDNGQQVRYSVLRHRRYSRFPWLDIVLNRFDMADETTRRLQQAGLPLRAGEFLFLQLAAA